MDGSLTCKVSQRSQTHTKRIPTVWFYLHKVQNQAKLNHIVKELYVGVKLKWKPGSEYNLRSRVWLPKT